MNLLMFLSIGMLYCRFHSLVAQLILYFGLHLQNKDFPDERLLGRFQY